jgi:hypothetical protein
LASLLLYDVTVKPSRSLEPSLPSIGFIDGDPGDVCAVSSSDTMSSITKGESQAYDCSNIHGFVEVLWIIAFGGAMKKGASR